MRLNLLRWLMPIILIAGACSAYRLCAKTESPAWTAPRGMPFTIAPSFNYPLVATDAQLHAVLDRMKPRADRVNTNWYIHALRLWGPKADFQDPAFLSGETLKNYFLDDTTFRQVAGEKAPPLFERTKRGLEARPWKSSDPFADTSSAHVDDLLATLGEIGTPLDQRLIARQGSLSVGDLLEDSLKRFQTAQQEYEWSAISYARYVFPQKLWVNRAGQRITLDDVLDELIDHSLEEGVCGGTHRLEALVVLLKADEQAQGLSKAQRKRIVEHLAGVSRLLIRSQQADGSWTRGWQLGKPPAADAKRNPNDEILLTGHHLEWLALAPKEVQPSRETIVRAGQWLVRAMSEVEESEIAKHYGPFSHAARALCMWRSQEPFDAWRGAAPLQNAE